MEAEATFNLICYWKEASLKRFPPNNQILFEIPCKNCLINQIHVLKNIIFLHNLWFCISTPIMCQWSSYWIEEFNSIIFIIFSKFELNMAFQFFVFFVFVFVFFTFSKANWSKSLSANFSFSFNTSLPLITSFLRGSAYISPSPDDLLKEPPAPGLLR